MWRNWNSCWWECKMMQPLWKTVWRFLKELKIEPPNDSAISLLGIYPKELKSGSQRDTSIPMFFAALLTIAKMWKQPKCPLMDEWIRKMWHIHTMEYYSDSKKKAILQHATTWLNLEDLLSEVSQSQKDKACMIPLIETESGCQGLRRGGNGKLLFNEYKVLVLQDEYVLEICCVTVPGAHRTVQHI